jgi:hypothetical protein
MVKPIDPSFVCHGGWQEVTEIDTDWVKHHPDARDRMVLLCQGHAVKSPDAGRVSANTFPTVSVTSSANASVFIEELSP